MTVRLPMNNSGASQPAAPGAEEPVEETLILLGGISGPVLDGRLAAGAGAAAAHAPGAGTTRRGLDDFGIDVRRVLRRRLVQQPESESSAASTPPVSLLPSSDADGGDSTVAECSNCTTAESEGEVSADFPTRQTSRPTEQRRRSGAGGAGQDGSPPLSPS